jgi:hypothetical protein
LIAQLIAFVLAFLVVIFLVLVIHFLSPKKQSKDKRREAESHEVPEMSPTMKTKPHMWEKYPPMIAFEMLYWQGVEEPWRWNSYAQDLIKYADEHLPLKNLEYTLYNASRLDPGYIANMRRIEKLRLKKIRRFPLVAFTYTRGEELVSVDSTYAYQYVIDRIDAEWDRYYGLV